MSAPNALGLRCPVCNGSEQIEILATTWLRVTADGTQADPPDQAEYHYGPDHFASCESCRHTGRLRAFRID